MRLLPRLVLVITALAALPACGSAACGAMTSCGKVASPSPSTAASATAGTASANGWTTTATVNPTTGVITVAVSVPGPLQVDGGCVPELGAWLVSAGGQRVEASPTPAAARCMAIQVEDVPAGQSRTFTTSIPRTTPGTYSVHGLLRTHLPIGAGARVSENIPVVSITIP